MVLNEITGAVVDAAIKVHSVLGPGLLEHAYQACLAYELRKRGFVPVHEAQLLSYLKLGNFQAGLLINFHAARLKDGIKRMVN